MMNYCLRVVVGMIAFFIGYSVQAQKNPVAKNIYTKAYSDSSQKKYADAAEEFYMAAKEELKSAGADPFFTANCYYSSGVLYETVQEYAKAHEAYYLSMEQYRKAKNSQDISKVIKSIAALYNETGTKNVIYNFPVNKKQETILAYRSILSLKNNSNYSIEVSIDGGTNDGVYEGADAEVYGKHRKQGEDRANRLLGSAKITEVYPNYSKALIQLNNPKDSFYTVYAEDMVAIPIRFPKHTEKDIFLEVSLKNIKFLDNYRETLGHPRTLMYYASPQLEKEIYQRMLDAVVEIYEMIKEDTTYNPKENITRGRLKGITWKQAMNRSTIGDLKAFLGFVRSYPGKYMGGEWKISETYATWLINNAPPGSDEVMDSLAAAKTDREFNNYLKFYEKDIKEDFFTAWLVDVQNLALSNKFDEAYKWNKIIQRLAVFYKDPDLIGWSFFNLAKIQDGEKKYDAVMESYLKAKASFEKGKDEKGLSFCINNLGANYSTKYMYKESQQMYQQVLQMRLNRFKTDTSDEQKISIARSYWGIGDALYNQSNYSNAIDQYKKGLSYVSSERSLEARKQTANLYRLVGKSFEKMGDYQQAANFYEQEYSFQKTLGDIEAQADAMDNQAYLLSKLGNYRESKNKYELAFKQHLQVGEKNDAAHSMSNIGQVWWSLGKFDSAINAHNQSISLRREAGNLKGEAGSWKKIGGLYKESGDAAKSSEAYQKALDIFKKIEAKEDYGELLEDVASNYLKIKDYVKAEKNYLEALKLYVSIKSRNKEADLLSAMGNMFYEDKKMSKADEYFVRAIAIQRDINDRSGLLYSYMNRGSVAQFLKEDYKDAIGKMQLALTIAEETKSDRNIAFCQNKIGSLYSFLNEYDSALVYYDRAMTIYQKLEDKENIAAVYINYGYYYNYRGNFEKARDQFEKSLVVAKQINNAYSIASANYGLSTYYYTKGEFGAALKSIEEVLAIYREKDNPWGIASVYLDQGNIRNQQGEFDEALKYYYTTDSIYKKLGLEKPRISVANNIGTIFYHQKNYEAALKQFEQTRMLLDKYSDDPAFISLVKSNIGEVLVDQKKNKEAEKWLLESLKMGILQKNNRQLYLSNMIYGRLQSNNLNYSVAEKYFRTADSLLSIGGEKTVLIQLFQAWGQMLYDSHQPALAEKKLLECIKFSDQTQFRNYAWKAYSTLADIQLASDNSEQGIGYLKTAIQEVEKIKSKITGVDAKKIFSSDESIVELYQKMVVQLKKEGKVEEALVYMEKANAENIKLRLSSTAISYDNAEANEAVAKEKELRKQQSLFENEIAREKAKPEQLQHKEQIAQWEKMRSVTSEQYKAYVNELKVKYPNLKEFKTFDPTEFMAQRRKIPPDVAVISYLVTDKEMSVFVVMKDTIFIKDIPINRMLLQQKIKNFYALNAHSVNSANDIRGGKLSVAGSTPVGKSDKNQLAAELYELLIKPLIKDISQKQRIAIVPSGFLCFVPFDALIYKDEAGAIQYFGEQKQLFYVNKISTITSGFNEPVTEFRVLAVGNADKSLPNAEDEVKALQVQLPQTVIFLREQATKKNVLGNKGNFNILHLATHGILDYSNADSSYLVLASDPANHDNGRLTIAQIQSMTDIDRFRMVTLSACETAVIREVAEGWPISTASAFIEMGVPTVIATLWQVDDKATRIFINKFYEYLHTMDKVQALQQAQMYLKKQSGYEDPYYWAPFQLMGLWK